MAGPTSGLSDVAILTPNQLYQLVIGVVIDNNINYITPAIMRSVLIPIIAAYAGRASNISGQTPINYDAFTGKISIVKVDAGHDGYLSKEDWAAFNNTTAGTDPVARVGDLKLKAKGYQSGVLNTDPGIEVGDIVFGFGESHSDWWDSALCVNLTDLNDQNRTNYMPLVSSGLPTI